MSTIITPSHKTWVISANTGEDGLSVEPVLYYECDASGRVHPVTTTELDNKIHGRPYDLARWTDTVIRIAVTDSFDEAVQEMRLCSYLHHPYTQCKRLVDEATNGVALLYFAHADNCTGVTK